MALFGGTTHRVYTPPRPSSIQINNDSIDSDRNADRDTDHLVAKRKILPSQTSCCQEPTVAKRRNYSIFEPGVYEFFIEFPVPQTCPETMKVRGTYVHYQLEASVKLRAVLTANIHKVKDVILVRVPDIDLLNQAGPIVVDKDWKDWLHYNLMIPSKSCPIGSKMPMTLRLSSAKIRCHSLQVFLIENIGFLGQGGKIYRRAPERKIELLDKSIEPRYLGDFQNVGTDALLEKSPVSTQILPATTMAGSGKRNGAFTPRDTNRAGLKHGPTIIELQVQLPSCLSMRASGSAQRIHPDIHWDSVNVTHWIKVKFLRLPIYDPI